MYYTYIPDIINKIHDLFYYAINQRSRNLYIRFDLHFPDNGIHYDEDYIFGKFMKAFTSNRQRNYGRVYYMAVREIKKSIHGHYHLFILLPEKLTQNLNGHMEYAKALWNSYFDLPKNKGGLINYRSHKENNGIKLNPAKRTFFENLRNCLEQSQYLAKDYSKQPFAKHHNTYSSTKNIPPREQDLFGPEFIRIIQDNIQENERKQRVLTSCTGH